MADYVRTLVRFLFRGLNLVFPTDAQPDGKVPAILNMRSYQESTLEVREGTSLVQTATASVHTIARLNDPTPFNGGVGAIRVVGAAGSLETGTVGVGDPLTVIDSGYSGDPLTTLAATPVGSPQPYLYVMDRDRHRKLTVAQTPITVGIDGPNDAPNAVIAAPLQTLVDDFDEAFVPWINAGVGNSLGQIDRINTVITGILYDQGATGQALVSLANDDQLGSGMTLVFGGTETAIVEEVRPPTVTTKIAAILYDVGSTGLCTIQPAASLSSGQIQLPAPNVIQTTHIEHNRFITKGGTVTSTGFVSPVSPYTPNSVATPLQGVRELSEVNFPVDCLIGLNNGTNSELVRVLSAVMGRDGIQSFRCRTVATFGIGTDLIGIVGVRVYLTQTHAVGETVTSKCMRNNLTSADGSQTPAPQVGGIRTGPSFIRDLSLINGPQTQNPSPPGGGGGSFGPHVDYVQAAKDNLVMMGADLSTPCGAHQIVIDAVTALDAAFPGEAAGRLQKTTGENCNGFAVDIICYPDGHIYDVLGSSQTLNIPQWNDAGFVDPARYVGPGAPVIPPPTPFPPPPALQTGGIVRPTRLEDEFHLSIRIDKLFAVQEIRVYFDVDQTVNDFTHNFYQVTFTANDIIAAIASAEASAVTPLTTIQQTVVVPRAQTRNSNVALSPDTQQLALGNDQWMELRWKVKDMIHVGTQEGQTLANVHGAAILVQYDQVLAGGDINHGFASVVQVSYDAFYLTGGYGADAWASQVPYLYTYRYRSRATGEKSNPAPPTPASLIGSPTGVMPRRQRVVVSAEPSPNPNADTVDFFRIGGTLLQWTYLGSEPNTGTPTFSDEFGDLDVLGGDALEFDNYALWPATDLPRTGVCNVAGNAVQWVSGDAFNPSWAIGSGIKINGIPTNLYSSPISATRLTVADNIGALTNVPFELPSATILDAKSPVFFGPLDGFYFSVDPNNFGRLLWTKGNNPDTTSDKNSVDVVAPSTPLQNGWVKDEAAFIASTQDVFRILGPYPQEASIFVAKPTPCGRGFWTRWAFCDTPQGTVFLAEDGIFITANGSPAQSLTDADLYPLFPHDGVPGTTVARFGITYQPVDMSATTALRLTYADGFVYFDYQDTQAVLNTLVFDLKALRWYFDRYTPPVTCRLEEPGAGVHQVIAGHTDGTLTVDGGVGDQGVALAWGVQTADIDAGDPRREKVFGDLFLSVDPAGSASGFVVTPGFNGFTTTLPPTTVGAGLTGRGSFLVDILAGLGLLRKRIAIQIQGLDASVRPTLFQWEPSFLTKVERTALRATDWDDCGVMGSKFVQGIELEFDSGGATRTVQVQYDGGLVGATFTVADVGQGTTPISFTTPFVAHLLRLVLTDTEKWLLYRWKWWFQPIPELVSVWQTPATTHDLPGYAQEERTLLAHISTEDFTYAVTVDGETFTYRIPNSGGVYTKTEILERPNKGLSRSYRIATISGLPGVRVFQQDIEVRIKAWNDPSPYASLRPFGDLSRESSAARI